MYRRPKSLEVLLAIRTEMSEEAGYDIPAFVEMVRSGVRPADNARTVTRVDGEHREAIGSENTVSTSRVAAPAD
jgi:hypothetical protein